MKWNYGSTGPKGAPSFEVGAQVAANELNKQWTSPTAGTTLAKRSALPPTNPASKTRLEVATVFMAQGLGLHTYIKHILNDHVISHYVIPRPLQSEYHSLPLGAHEGTKFSRSSPIHSHKYSVRTPSGKK